MHMIGHYHITDQTKSRCIAHSSQFFHEEVSCPRCFQKRQSPVTTESNKVQIAFAVIAFKTRQHRQPSRRNNHPKTQVPTPNLGHPPSLYTSPRRAAVISSPRLKCQRISNFRSGPPSVVRQFRQFLFQTLTNEYNKSVTNFIHRCISCWCVRNHLAVHSCHIR